MVHRQSRKDGGIATVAFGERIDMEHDGERQTHVDA